MTVAALSMVLIVCWFQWNYYRDKTRCSYCGGEWSKHREDCPAGGSGITL